MRPLAALLLLAACAPTGPGFGVAPDYAPADAPLPPEVERMLPADIPGSDVRVREGCYAYVFDGTTIPLLTESGNQFCIG